MEPDVTPMERTSAASSPIAAPASGRARWTNLASLGFALAALGPLLMLAASVVFGLDMSEIGAFLAVPVVVGFLTAFLVRRFGTWAKVVGVVVGLLMMGMLFWTMFGLFIPTSFFDFVPGLLVVPGGIMAITGCIASIVANKRGHRGETPVGGERTAIRVALGLITTLAIVSAGATLTAASDAPEGARPAITIAAKDATWGKDSYTIKSGAEILVRNDDPFFHTATVDAVDIDESLTPGSEAIIKISQPGTYVLYCEPHTGDPENPDEDDMATTVVVT